MGIFGDILLGKNKEYSSNIGSFSEGTLYETMSRLGDKFSASQKAAKVSTLLAPWYASASAFLADDGEIPVYALEMHCVRDRKSLQDGYGAYIFVPDSMRNRVILPIGSIFSKPIELYDEEDPVKILAASYAGRNGGDDKEVFVYELALAEPDYRPFKIWDKNLAIDPLEERFGLFDSLKEGEFAGISLVFQPPPDDWRDPAKKAIREIEDPDYSAVGKGALQRFISFLNDEEPDRSVNDEKGTERMTGYKKQSLGMFEQALIAGIKDKIQAEAFLCSLRVYASSDRVANELSTIVCQRTSGPLNRLSVVNRAASLDDLARRKISQQASFLMTIPEISTIWHVPDEETSGKWCHRPLPEATEPPADILTIETGSIGDIQSMFEGVMKRNSTS